MSVSRRLLPAFLACAFVCSGAAAEHLCPRAARPPAVDGTLDDAAWKTALTLDGFTLPKSDQTPPKQVEARLCFDAKALYVAFVCAEPHPERIKADARVENDGVWQDDCVEVWVRTTDSSLEFDQFIVNTLGTRQSVRRRQSPGAAWKPAWRAKVARGPRQWVAEMRIPFADLALDAARPGDMFELKLGREDHTGPKVVLSTWPPRSSYAGVEHYAPVYFERSNLLPNPDMSERDGGRVARWGFGTRDAGLFRSVQDGGQRAIRFQAPGRYSTGSQSLRLKPHARYRIEARVKGTAGIYVRARTVLRKGGPSVPHTANVPPSADYRRIEVPFPTGPDGRALLIIGNTEGGGKGEALIAGLRVVREPAFDAFGPAIPLEADAEQPLVVQKLLVTDCRALKGFLGAPVDGTLQSGDWGGQTWEYNQRGAGGGVGYAYHGSDGLHITLADDQGIHAVLIRGGARVKMYRDCPRYDEPAGGKLLATFPGRANRSRAWFEDPVRTRRVSFFALTDGRLADVSFFRVRRAAGRLGPGPAVFAGWASAAGALSPWLARRFDEGHRQVFGLVTALYKSFSIRATKGKWLHLMGTPFRDETPLAAIGLTFAVESGPTPLAFTAAVQDPLNPRSQLFGADLLASKPGRCRVVLDFPDQVVPGGTPLWLSLKFAAPVTLASVAVRLVTAPRPRAAAEALAYRKLLLKAYFCALSEARPWMRWYDDRRMKQGLAEKRWGPQLQQLVQTLDHCKRLGPKDDLVRQYDEWVYQNHRERKKARKPLQPRLDSVPGAPPWAVVARQAWLTARDVPKWWLDHRMVPTGEFGGLVGDDSDMYQNYADFPMFETGGVAARIKDGAARLAELAERDTLERGLNRRTMDPLHAYEEGLNQEALMAWWNYGDPLYLERCIVAARSTEALTVLTPKGHRHFKSQRCGAADLRMDRKPDVDGQAHPLMWHPTLEVAWYNANPRALEHLRQWADGWLDHMQPGKYATAVDVASERVVATTHRPLYGGYGSQGSAFLYLYWLTDDPRYLEPFFEQFRKGSRNTAPHLILPELIHRHGLAFLGPKLQTLVQGEGAAETLVTADKQPLIDALVRDIAHLQRFPHMYTAAEQFTDRIFLYAIRNAAIAYTGGYAARNKIHHTHAVSWEGFGTDYAALVLAAKRDRFKALVYSFADAPVTGRMRLWTLDHGRYALTVGPDANRDDKPDRAARTETLEVLRATAVPLTLAPNTVTVLELRQQKRLDDERLRADLALAPREVRVEGGVVRAVAHNLGSKRVERFDVALLDATGKVRARKTLGPLDAPLDLVPRRLSFELRGLPPRHPAWTLAIDPEGRIPEIYEGNNRIPLTSP